MLFPLTITAIHFFYKLIILVSFSFTFYSDDAIYASLAKLFLSGHFLQAFHPTWPPLYPFLSALSYLFLNNWATSTSFVSVLAGSLITIPLFYLAKDLLPRSQAAIYALLTPLFLPMLQTSLLPLSDMLATTLSVSSLISIYFAIKIPKTRRFFCSGILLGLTYLNRSEGTMFFFLSLAFLSFYLLLKKNLLYLLPFTIAFFLVASPYLITTRLQMGYWTLSPKASAQIKQGHAFELKNNTTWSQDVVSTKLPNYQSPYFKGGLEHLLEYGDWYWWWFKQKSQNWQSFFLNLFPPWSLFFVFLGSLSLIKKGNFFSLGYLLFILICAIPITIFSTAMVDVRYLLWTFPFLILFLFLGINTLFRRLALPALLLILFLPSFSLPTLIHPTVFAESLSNQHQKPNIPLAATWILENSAANPRIMSRHEGLEFYTNGFTIYIPQTDYQTLLTYAKEKNVDFIIASNEELESDQNLSFLIESNSVTPGLKKVHQLLSGKPRIIIYQLENEN